MSRIYLDWNATAPLRPEARAAMLAAMDAAGNPSSVHSEGRAAKAIMEKARGQVAALVGCDPVAVVFTSGATEAAHAVLSERWPCVHVAAVEHDCVFAPATARDRHTIVPVDVNGKTSEYQHLEPGDVNEGELLCVQAANSETGVLQNWFDAGFWAMDCGAKLLVDFAQVAGRVYGRAISDPPDAHYKLISAHKLGGPVGTGALILDRGDAVPAPVTGGGQEQGRRSGTENVIGIAGFGAAAEAARRGLESGVWNQVSKLRDSLEERLAAIAPDLIIFGKDAPRLPNTSCFAIPGWKGETQVMQMDLAGFAISAGSACSSGKVGPSRVLLAMGFDEETAASAIRVSMGPTTSEAEVMGFADTWIEHYRRRKQRAA